MLTRRPDLRVLRVFFFSLLAAFTLGFPVPDAGAATHTVNVRNFVFEPANLTIQSGDIVRWVWVEGMHTTTSGAGGSPDGLWNAPIDAANTQFQRTFNTAGTFPYFCAFHFGIGMVGSITVEGGGGNQAPVVTNPGTQSGEEETFFSVTVSASDPDGDALAMTDLGTTPAWATFTDNDNNTATISGTPGLGDAGTYTQSVRASDGSLTDTESFDIVIDAAPIVQVDLDGTFTPADVTIPVGWSVRWVKVEGGQHTTTSGTGGVPDGIWSASLTSQSPTFERMFDTPGTFPYFCESHPTAETGTVTVEDTTSAVFDVEIQAVNFQFVPQDTSILVGQTVKWSWIEGMHTTTSGTSSDPADNPGTIWDDSLTVTSPMAFVTFDVPGIYPYFCRPHEVDDMRGTITVTDTATVGVGDTAADPRPGLLAAPHPNPFRSTTTISFTLERESEVRLDIFDVRGRLVRNFLIATFPAGRHTFQWSGRDDLGKLVAGGVYFLKLRTEGRSDVRKVYKVR